MPNPIRKLKSTRGLTVRQKNLVKRIKRQGLVPKVYGRKSSPSKLSVHNPFLDVLRKSKKQINARYPHASDTNIQRKLLKSKTSRKRAKKYSKQTKGRIAKEIKSFLNP